MSVEIEHPVHHAEPPETMEQHETPAAPLRTALLAEDNADDILLMRLACERSGIPHLLKVVSDGAMAIEYLSGQNAFADRLHYPMPSVVFLDINMPKQSGFEVLKWIRAKPSFKSLPVVMLSNSTLMPDVDRAYQLGVTSYLRKVASQTEFTQAVRIILKYWLQMTAGP